jgi:cyclin H
MLAALASVDEGLADMLIERSFAPESEDVPETDPRAHAVKVKLIATLSECRRMLDEEPPHRMQGYWGTAEANNEFKPLLRKLRRCRDPDRANLVALQAARREQVSAKEQPPAGKDMDDVFGGAL